LLEAIDGRGSEFHLQFLPPRCTSLSPSSQTNLIHVWCDSHDLLRNQGFLVSSYVRQERSKQPSDFQTALLGGVIQGVRPEENLMSYESNGINDGGQGSHSDLHTLAVIRTKEKETNVSIEIIEARFRTKAKINRWEATRLRRKSQIGDFSLNIKAVDREITGKTSTFPDGLLSMNPLSGPSPSDLLRFDDLAGCFDTGAAAIALVRSIRNASTPNQPALKRSFELLAESLSALQGAVEMSGHGKDNDQLQAFIWLRESCRNEQQFIKRYMKIEDSAKASSWPDINRRIEELDSQLQRDKQKRLSLKRISYHIKLIMEDRDGGKRHDWEKIIDTVEGMVQGGLPPSDKELRNILLPVIERMPDLPQPSGFARVLREIDRFTATRRAAQDTSNGCEPSGEIKAVADLLRGKTVVLIGGDRRNDAHNALKNSFGLKELNWVEAKEHESITMFQSHISRPEVALVLLAIKWASHSFGDVKAYCDRYGKPLVRLPAGYNPNQVAMQILKQASDKLAGK
jgi:hypothetical protein